MVSKTCNNGQLRKVRKGSSLFKHCQPKSEFLKIIENRVCVFFLASLFCLRCPLPPPTGTQKACYLMKLLHEVVKFPGGGRTVAPNSPADLDLQHAPVEVGAAVRAADGVLFLAAAVVAARAGVPHARLGVLVYGHACGIKHCSHPGPESVVTATASATNRKPAAGRGHAGSAGAAGSAGSAGAQAASYATAGGKAALD